MKDEYQIFQECLYWDFQVITVYDREIDVEKQVANFLDDGYRVDFINNLLYDENRIIYVVYMSKQILNEELYQEKKREFFKYTKDI